MTRELERLGSQEQVVKNLTEDDRRNINLIRRNKTFIQKLFPSELQQVIDVHELNQAQSELEFREKALKLVKEAQLQCIQEIYNDFLERGKAKIRRDRTEFYLMQRNILQDAVNRECQKFTESITREFSRIDTITIPELKNREKERLYLMIESYHRTVRLLMEDFEEILYEKIRA